jgi:hypothetical protein
MGMTLTQFSNLLNLMTQAETRLKFYHFGWRSDININPQNNYNPNGSTGRLYPALHCDIPDYLTYQDEPQPSGLQQKARINLYFDTLQGKNNDGSLNVESMLEQFTSLKKISEDFMSNLVVMMDYYGSAFLDTKPTFTPRANMHNDNLVTIEVAFDVMLIVECTDVAFQIDPSGFPATLDIEDLERVIGTPPTRCQRIVSGLTKDDLLYCIQPLYDYSDTETQQALDAQQIIDLQAFICTPVTPNVPSSFLLDGFNESFSTPSTALNDWDGKTPFTITCWMRSSDYSKAQGILAKMVGASLARGWYFVITSTGFGLAKAGTSGDVTTRTTTITNTNNTWYHFAFTDDGSGLATGMKLYRDGVLMTPTSTFTAFNTTATNAAELEIGTFLNGGFLEGNVCYTRVWKKEFTADDIEDDYNGGFLLENPLYPDDLAAGFKPNETAIYANTIWNARNEADATNGFGSSNNLEYSDLTTDIPT